MPTNSLIDRDDAGALIPEQVANSIFKRATELSTVMSLGRRLPNMARGQLRLPVLSSLPTAYFVDGDTGVKQTTEVAWANKYINAGEIAVIVPIPDTVADDADYNIAAEIEPLIAEAFAVKVDSAILHGGGDTPNSWPTAIVAGATAASHTVAAGTGADLYEDILGQNGIISLIEADGFMATGHVAAMSMRGRLRGVRASTGELIFSTNMQQAGSYLLDGAPIQFPKKGALNASAALLISGDWSELVWSVRKDVSVKKFTEGVITDTQGRVIYNLMQQDMSAIRAVFRLGWQLPNPVNRLQPTEASRYPFAVLTP